MQHLCPLPCPTSHLSMSCARYILSTPPPYFKVSFNDILPPRRGSSKPSPFLRFSNQINTWTSVVTLSQTWTVLIPLRLREVNLTHSTTAPYSSSSSGSTTSVIECFGLLNDFFPFTPVLDAVLPIIYFHDIQIILTSFSHPVWGLPNDLIAIGFHSYTLTVPHILLNIHHMSYCKFLHSKQFLQTLIPLFLYLM
jgi:hypothetical protein